MAKSGNSRDVRGPETEVICPPESPALSCLLLLAICNRLGLQGGNIVDRVLVHKPPRLPRSSHADVVRGAEKLAGRQCL